ncbi:MAG: PAS domain S-box protein, partial [Methanothrix sp.]|nr:PAS domain S-box protein [Methanothrix sp.]
MRCISDPGNAEEILSDALEQLQDTFEELSAADEELMQQNEELIASQEALKQANDRLDMAQRAAGAGVWDWSVTTNHIEWSPELFDLFGLDPQRSAASFEAWNSVIYPEDREIANSRIDQALMEHTSLNSVYRIIRPDGQICWINALGQGTYDDQGCPVRMIGICIDITERMLAEERLRITLESIGDGFFACDADWRFVYVNAAAERILGIRRDEVLGKSHWDVFPLTLGTNLEREYRCAAAGEVRDFENFYEPWGRGFHNRCFPRECGGMSVYFEDITKRKRTEEELTRLASFPRLNPNPIVEVDTKGCVFFLNPAAQELLPDLEERGQDHPWLANWESVARMLCDSQTGTYVRDVSIGDNWYQQTMYFMPDVQRIRIYSLDITERKNAEIALQKSNVDREVSAENLRLAYNRLQAFFDHRIGGIGVVIANDKGDILQANDYYLSILGCTREEFLSGQANWRKMTPLEWLPADERALAQLRERGVCDTYEKEYVCQDGTRVPVSITDVMMPGDSGDILAFVFDITERKRSEVEIQKLMASVQQEKD